LKISFFYENKKILNEIDELIKKKTSAYEISQISEIVNIKSDFLILEVRNNKLEEIINKLEIDSDTPYIIISENIPQNETYHGLYLVSIIDKKDISQIKNKILEYFKKNKQDEFSIFELPDVMQMVSMEKKDIAIRIISKSGNVGAIAFEKGRPIYAKSIMNKKSETGIEAVFKILSWDDIKFKLIKVIGETPYNLDIDLTDLLMGAMQYKDELAYINEEAKNNEEIKNDEVNKGKVDCKNIVEQFNNLKGYIGISIFKDGKELCSNHLKNSYIKNKDLKSNVYKINKLVRNMLNDIGIANFTNLILSSSLSTAIIEHDEKNKIDTILFLEKDANIPLSKLMMKKVIVGLL